MYDPLKPVDIFWMGKSEPCEHFFGREEEIESIHNALNCYGKIFVEGLPGIGKSEVAKGYARAYKKEYTNILYIMYSGDLQRDIANLCFADDMPNEEEKDRLYRHDRFLRTLNEDTLLIIDNFDTKSAKEASLFNLRKYHCHILITTRCRWAGYRRMRIGPVKDVESLFQMVAQFYPDAEENRETVMKIMEEVQWNTLMVELIGRLLGQGLNRPDDVLTKLYYLGTLVSGDEKVRISKDGRIRRDTVTAHIQALMALSELTAGQKEIMRCMVLIPPTGISELLLVRWMNLDNANEIEELIERGYLTQLKDNNVMMPRSIQKACLAELIELLNKYQSERNEKAAQLKELEQQLDSTQAVQDDVQNWADMIRQYRNLDTLDRETLLRLIDKIEVGEKKIVDGHKEQEIRIHYKFVGFIQ